MNAEAQIRKGRKFDQVIEGAKAVFLREGFEGASVDEIARDAGVSKATLYSYFPDKQHLFPRRARDGMRAPVRGGTPHARGRA
jgi:TetR/AcrR family transcriptional repressor of mexJK operon